MGEKSVTLTETLAERLVHLKFEDLPKSVIDEAKLCFLDTLGCIYSAAQRSDIRDFSEKLASTTSEKNVSIIGMNDHTSLLNAAIINGTMAHTVEMDDVHKQAKSHAGAVVVPTVLTYGNYLGSSGKELLLAIVVGYETMLRIGRGINATEHRLQGWHATSTCGTFGAAASTAVLANLNEDDFVHALGLAGTQSSGLWAFTANAANSKKFHAGNASASGILSVLLVKSGLTGANQILEAKDGGLFKASSGNYSYKQVTSDIQNEFLIEQITRKPFACCRSMHPSIEAALKAREHDIPLHEINRIIVKTYEVAKVQCGFTNTPNNVSEAQFSIPYGVSVALHEGNVLIDQFSIEKIMDESIRDLAKKVEIVVDSDFDQAYPNNWGCELEIQLNNGKLLVEKVVNAKGDPENPLTKEEMHEKFIYLSKGLIGETKCKEIISMVDNLEKYEQASELLGNILGLEV